MLVADKPAAAIPDEMAQYAGAAWLAKRHAITVLPSVASLGALRQLAKTSAAMSALRRLRQSTAGRQHRHRQARLAEAILRCSGCNRPAGQPARARRRDERLFRGGLANVDEVRRQEPLPETADERCAVAGSLGAEHGAVHLGEKSSETALKALSASGALARVKVVHFATHGLLAGETEMLSEAKAEPALILTPPEKATELDDGLLTASEISQLKLDADWGAAVRLQHRRRRQRHALVRGSPVGPGARVLLCGRQGAIGLALGGQLRCHRPARHQGVRCAERAGQRRGPRRSCPPCQCST